MAIRLGIQLYSVRDQVEKDFSGTLRALKEMGFEGVEFAWNYGNLEPVPLADFLKKTGLACCGLHTSLKDLQDAGSKSYQYAKAVASRYITTSCCDKDELANWDQTIAALAEAGRVAAAQGLQFTYHNHAPEFQTIDKQTLLDRLYTRTSAAVGAELDTAWIFAGGQDPVAYIHRYAGRTPQVHVKDFSKATNFVIEVGKGELDFPAIIAAARKAKADWLIYELDASTLGDSLTSARQSIKLLKQWLA